MNPQADPRKYICMATALRAQIEDGTLRPGDRAPSIAALAAEHGGARQTVAKALRMLEAEGLIFRVPGLGYHVNGPVSSGKAGDQQPPVLRVAGLLRGQRHSRPLDASLSVPGRSR
jgi:DNA-binding GntR family transcriptional regulator